MIKNIVFGIGNVLIDYMADGVYRHFIKDPGAHKRVSIPVFISPGWILLDMGIIPGDTALKEMQAHLDIEEKRGLAALCSNRWHELNMYKKEGIEDVIRWLKSIGYGIYLCLNASVRLLSYHKNVLSAVDCLNGILFSADIPCLKPQEEIYGHLFERSHLKPEECSFADDLELNIEGVRHCGMDGYCFDDRNVEKLRGVLTGPSRR